VGESAQTSLFNDASLKRKSFKVRVKKLSAVANHPLPWRGEVDE
jgi:hypothetical protein